jgi:hypothetical protein
MGTREQQEGDTITWNQTTGLLEQDRQCFWQIFSKTDAVNQLQ